MKKFSPRLLDAELPGLFRDDYGYWTHIKFRSDGRWHWRKLDALTKSAAVKECSAKRLSHQRYLAGENVESPFESTANTFQECAKLYLSAGCPDAHRNARVPEFCDGERARIDWLVQFFGGMKCDEIDCRALERYVPWRKRHCTRGGNRVIELEWVTASNVISYAVYHRLAQFNYIRQQRPKLRLDNPGTSTAAKIRHARDVSPASGDVIHQVAGELLSRPDSESTGWVWLFACLTGLRRNELLALRIDARPPLNAGGLGEPGYCDDKWLYVRREKRSNLHRVLLYPELSDLISAHFRWHQSARPASPWYFPGERDENALAQDSPGQAIERCCRRLKLPHLTMHGCRSYFATWLRSKGLSDGEVATRIGDRTWKLIQQAYGNLPGNWEGGEVLSVLPKEVPPAWAKWSAIKEPGQLAPTGP